MVVSLNESAINTNPYESCTLQEACTLASLAVDNLIYELNMGILLDDHTCLLETETSLLVINQKKEDTSEEKESAFKIKLEKIKDRVINALRVFKEKVFEIFDKIKNVITTKISKYRILPLKNKFKEGCKVFQDMKDDTQQTEFVLDKVDCTFDFGPKGIYNEFDSNNKFYATEPDVFKDESDIHSADEVYSEYVKSKDEYQGHKAAQFYIDGIDKGYGMGWSTAFIDKSKKDIDDELSKNIADIKKYDKYDDSLAKYSLMMKNNMNVVNGFVKVWNKWVNECIKVIIGISNFAKESDAEFREVKEGE